jgi:hypothetical protein
MSGVFVDFLLRLARLMADLGERFLLAEREVYFG